VAEPTLPPDAGQHGRQPGAVTPAAPAAPGVLATPAAPATAATPANAAGLGPASLAAPAWSAGRWLGFRFVFVYLLIYNLPVAASWVPGAGWLIARYQELWAAAVPWVGRHVLHLARPIAAAPNGSGDRTFDYVQVLCIAALAALAALAWGSGSMTLAPRPKGGRGKLTHYLAWTALDRRPGRERALAEGLRIYLRYTLALILLTRGIGMLTGVRFPFPGIDRLQERLGDSSPLALFSTFMGYSPLYAGFIGGSEALAGLLLLFRRTTSLGALLALAMASHAAAFAFSYDVPEKLLSLHLLAIAAWLLAPDARRLVDGLLLDRPTLPPDLTPPLAGRWTRLGRLGPGTFLVAYARIAIVAIIAIITITAITRHDLHRRLELMRMPRPPIYGVWDVDELSRDGRVLPSWSSDLARWRRLIVRSPAEMAVQLASGARQSFAAAYGQRLVTLSSRDGSGSAGKQVPCASLAWSKPDPDHLVLQGMMSGEALTVRLRRVDESRVLLLTRGFHLISDDAANQ
jgi:uncharacterized membrane protein YphA (DoxX/SURF4 family)